MCVCVCVCVCVCDLYKSILVTTDELCKVLGAPWRRSAIQILIMIIVIIIIKQRELITLDRSLACNKGHNNRDLNRLR